ncbi:polyphenol oxidase family protein [Nocardioides acrostichi]|uniref:Polyphenol oxidase family protein n=1 Tax=Nocardioides acrostichi TaxID=2784339 RepID=A0A930Y9Q9_9ACTN|nr:polyphenol oxidase family protein [Nocardioides acrostichi]MBF4160628.1 polyphenol oxidase family protein [Nocardioides acrostichi]
MFCFRDHREGGVDPGVRVDVAFTDSSIDLQGLRPAFADELPRLEQVCGVRFARVNQVHGDDVLLATEPGPAPTDVVETADGIVTTTPGLGLMVRVADCVPVLLADVDRLVLGVAHAGRHGVTLGVVTRVVRQMRDQGAERIAAWVGPHVCGRCYEVPEQMRAEVAAVVPETWAETSWGTPALDLGAGVRAQLAAEGIAPTEVGLCTLEHDTLHSYRRDGADAGRLAGLVWTT